MTSRGPRKLPRFYSGNVITRRCVMFSEKLASCDLERAVDDFAAFSCRNCQGSRWAQGLLYRTWSLNMVPLKMDSGKSL